MKLRPQFNLRFHDIKEFEAVMDAAEKSDESMNETVLIKMRSGFGWAPWEENNGQEKESEVAAEKAGEIGRENRPAGIQSDRVGGKGGSVRAPKKGFEVGNNAEIATGGSAGVEKAIVLSKGERGLQKSAAYVNRELLLRKSVSEVAAVGAGAGFRGPGKCPHGWVDWLTCRNNGGGCE